MSSVYKERARASVAVRVMAVALVLACSAPQGMEAHAPVPVSGDGDTLSPGLSASDWPTIQARLEQAGAHAPLVTSQVAKLTASDATANDRFGYAVAASGDTIVVGAPYYDNYTGAAYIFGRNYDPDTPGTPLANNWGQVQKLTASDAAQWDYFGWSVSISGDTVVVGAYGDDDWRSSVGSAYVFERNQGGADNWGQVQKLTASDAMTYDTFGYAVSISGDTVVVAAPDGVAGGDKTGSAYVFERNHGGADNWGEVQKLTASDAAERDYFGQAVAISGDTAVVGAYGDDGLTGSAYVYERNYDPLNPSVPSADNWGEVQKLTAGDAAAHDHFGVTVAISGDAVVVGAYLDHDGSDDSGSAYVFERNQGGADDWGQVQKLTASDAAAHDRFGRAVSISGDAVVVGAYLDDDREAGSGSAYVFERNRGGADGWGQVQKLTASDAATYDRFGTSVAISGDTFVAGAPLDDNSAGSAYVFARQGATWTQQQKPTTGDAAASDVFGTSVAISNDTLISGAPGNDDSGSVYLFYRNEDGADQWGQVCKKPGSGGAGDEYGMAASVDTDTAVVGAPGADRAYIFERNGIDADLWGHVKTLTDTTAADFGNAVSISGDTVVVGAPFDNTACSDCGAAYVYERNYDPSNPGTPLADNWGLRIVLTATHNAATDDRFGWSVAISGDTVVVGAPYDTHSSKNQAGSVYVFKRNYDLGNPMVPKADNWGLVHNLQVDDIAAGDHFGHAVAISGDTFVVGAPRSDSEAGSAYVFERNHDGADGWGQVEKLTGDDTAGGDWFGWSVGISGDTMAVGAPYDDDGGNASGAAYLFKRNEGGADNWGQVEKLTASDEAADDVFGWSVGISGNTVAVGAPYDDDGGDGSGSTYVFRRFATAVYLPLVVRNGSTH